MPQARFEPDPLLSRTAPRGPASFDVLPLLAPARPVFKADGLAPAGQADQPQAQLTMQDPAQALPAPELDPVDQPGQADQEMTAEGLAPLQASAMSDGDPAPRGALVPAADWTVEQVQQALALRYREGFEDGLAQGAQMATGLASPSSLDPSADGLGDGHAGAALDLAAGGELPGLLQAVGRALTDLRGPEAAADRFEPLKRLALHLATELVRTELSVSPRIVDVLVRRCVQALDAQGADVVVELHPLDLQQLRTLQDRSDGIDQALQGVQWREDASLARGSVRARSDHSAVEDLIEQRLAGMVQDLRIDAQRWQREQEALVAGASTPSARASTPSGSAHDSGPDVPSSTPSPDENPDA